MFNAIMTGPSHIYTCNVIATFIRVQQLLITNLRVSSNIIISCLGALPGGRKLSVAFVTNKVTEYIPRIHIYAHERIMTER